MNGALRGHITPHIRAAGADGRQLAFINMKISFLHPIKRMSSPPDVIRFLFSAKSFLKKRVLIFLHLYCKMYYIQYIRSVVNVENARPKKEDRRVKYTKKAIRDGFLRLLAEKPIEKISVTEICREADINRGTFYAHYSDPYALKRSLEMQLAEAMQQRLIESGETRLSSLQTMRLLKEHEELCRVFAGPYGDYDAMLKVIRQYAEGYLEEKILFLGELSEPMTECLKGLLVSSISTAVKYWFDTGMKETPERVAYVLDTYCFTGVKGFLDDKRRSGKPAEYGE